MFTRFRLAIFLPIVILMLSIMSCLGTPTAVPTPTVPSDARSIVLRALQAVPTAGPYRVVASFTTGTTTNAVHGEVVLPDRFHLFSSINGAPEREYAIIGSNTFARTSGRWARIQIDLSSLLTNFINNMNPANISDVSSAGTEAVNGTPAHVYKFTYTNNTGGTTITSSVKMWIGDTNGLPIKQTVDGQVSGTTYHSEQTLQYDSSVTVETPAVP